MHFGEECALDKGGITMEIIVNHAEIHALMGEYLKIFIQYALPFGLFLLNIK